MSALAYLHEAIDAAVERGYIVRTGDNVRYCDWEEMAAAPDG